MLIKRRHSMARQIFGYQAYGCFVPHGSWRKTILAEGLPDIPDGTLMDITPRPGCTFTRQTWPPRGRGRGESLYSPRRDEAKFRTLEVLRLRRAGYTWQMIAQYTGFKDASGPWRAVN